MKSLKLQIARIQNVERQTIILCIITQINFNQKYLKCSFKTGGKPNLRHLDYHLADKIHRSHFNLPVNIGCRQRCCDAFDHQQNKIYGVPLHMLSVTSQVT